MSFVINVPDVDTVYARAVDAGATAERPVEDQFYGARAGWLSDPWGHRWSISTPLAAVPGRPRRARPRHRRTVPVVDLGDRAEPGRPTADDVVNLGYFTHRRAPMSSGPRAFYAALFGWQPEQGSPDEGRHIEQHHAARRPPRRRGRPRRSPSTSGCPTSRRRWCGCERSAATPASRSSSRRDGTPAATTTRASPSTSGSRPRATERACVLP